MSTLTTTKPQVEYPDSDGLPMSDNTLQFDWIAILKWGAEYAFKDDPDVFVAGDHLIYPIEGNNKIRFAPDVYASFGARKGYRGSYKVWEENGIFPQVIFEVWSPSNNKTVLREKHAFYGHFGAEEYYVVYPDHPVPIEGWLRRENDLVPIKKMNGHVSPRLGFRFEIQQGTLQVFGPDGKLLERPHLIAEQRDIAERERDQAKRERDESQREREQAEQRNAQILAKLREMGIDLGELNATKSAEE